MTKTRNTYQNINITIIYQATKNFEDTYIWRAKQKIDVASGRDDSHL
jgi:hypothetical protein